MEQFNFYPWLSALALLVFSNNIIGMLEAAVTKKFDLSIAKRGLAKAIGVGLSLVSFFYAGLLVPNVTFEYESISFTLQGILAVLMYFVIGAFAFRAIKKLAELMGADVKL